MGEGVGFFGGWRSYGKGVRSSGCNRVGEKCIFNHEGAQGRRKNARTALPYGGFGYIFKCYV